MPCPQTFLPCVAAMASSTPSASLWQCVLGGEKELCHGFSGHGLFAEMEDGFYKNSRAHCSHTSEEITSPTAWASVFPVALRAAAALADM